MAYCTLAEVRYDIDLESTDADETLERLILAAERAINRYTNRLDGFEADAVASARYFPGSGHSWQFIDECVEITTVAVKDSGTDTTYTDWDTPTTMLAGDGDWLPFSGGPDYPRYEDLPYTGLMCDPNGSYSAFVAYGGLPTVQVTARWGYALTVPDDIKEATIMQVARWYKQLQSAMADGVASPEFGELRFTSKLHPSVALILDDGGYKKPRIGRR